MRKRQRTIQIDQRMCCQRDPSQMHDHSRPGVKLAIVLAALQSSRDPPRQLRTSRTNRVTPEEARQIIGQVSGRGVTVLWFLFQALQTNGLENPRYVRIKLSR